MKESLSSPPPSYAEFIKQLGGPSQQAANLASSSELQPPVETSAVNILTGATPRHPVDGGAPTTQWHHHRHSEEVPNYADLAIVSNTVPYLNVAFFGGRNGVDPVITSPTPAQQNGINYYARKRRLIAICSFASAAAIAALVIFICVASIQTKSDYILYSTISTTPNSALLVKQATFTQLGTAIVQGRLNQVREILDSGVVDVNNRGFTGSYCYDLVSNATALILASACKSSVELMQYLLGRGAGVDDRDDAGWTALIRAAYHGRGDLCALLLDSGASINLETKAGNSALSLASSGGYNDTVRILLQRGAYNKPG